MYRSSYNDYHHPGVQPLLEELRSQNATILRTIERVQRGAHLKLILLFCYHVLIIIITESSQGMTALEVRIGDVETGD